MNPMHRSVLAFLLLFGVGGCVATFFFLLGCAVRWLKLYADKAEKRKSIKGLFLASLFYGTVMVYALAPPLEQKPAQTFLVAPLIVFSLVWPLITLTRVFFHNTVDIFLSIVSVVLGCLYAWLAFVALSVYCLSTLHGKNLAAIPHYHGPARIVGYTTKDSGESAAITVAYGGSWACPKYRDLDCHVELVMSSCLFYDQTGLWSKGNNHEDCYWSTWDSQNHWQDSFSCSEGFLDKDMNNGNGGKDDDDDDDGNDAISYTFPEGSYDPCVEPTDSNEQMAWPYLVSILADCQQCGAKIDNKHNRLVFSATQDMMPIMSASLLATVVFFSLAAFLFKHQKKRKSPILVHLEQNGTASF